ncbi:MAG: TolC family protein [bacterium]|nr:TolC family protein [bacterium]
MKFLATRTSIFLSLAVSGLLLCPGLPAEPAAGLPVIHIGTVVDGPSEVLEGVFPLVQEEILALTEGEFDVRFEDRHQRMADWTGDGVKAAIDTLLDDPEVDLLLALGVLASHEFCCRRELPKPVVAPVILDAEIQGVPIVDGHSAIANLNFLTMPRTLRRDLEAFEEVVSFRKIAIFSSQAIRSVAALQDIGARIGEVLRGKDLKAQFVAVGDSAAATLEVLEPDVDAVYVLPLHHLPRSELVRLYEGLAARRLPSFSWLGQEDVEAGALVGLGTRSYYPRLARRVALNVQRILLGEPPESLGVHFQMRQQLTINMATARATLVFPGWDLMVEAELLHEEDESIERVITLRSAVDRAVAANLDLLARSRRVAAGVLEKRRARAALLPRLEASALGVGIDSDRAESIFANQAERTVSGSLSLSQVLWVEPLVANVEIQEHLQRAREADYEQLRLDITQATTTAYLNVLRAKTLEHIQRDNLKLSRSNLELARVRRSVGTAVEAEVVRWESRIASDRRSLVNARARREQAKVALNRLLDRPLEEPFRIEDIDLQDPELITSEARLPVYTGDPLRFQLLRDFMVIEGLAAAPELAELDRLIAAKQRQQASARRAYYSPTVALQGEYQERLATSGAGSGSPDLSGLPFEFELPDDTSWSLALNVSLPLYTGGERSVEMARTTEELQELRLIRGSVAEKIEQRIRSALYAANATFQGIDLSRDAADAAQRNLDLVTDAYARGALSILDLLDAQNAALVADQGAANSVYDFLVDLMEVERAAASFGFFSTEADREAWFERLEQHLKQSGIRLDLEP